METNKLVFHNKQSGKSEKFSKNTLRLQIVKKKAVSFRGDALADMCCRWLQVVIRNVYLAVELILFPYRTVFLLQTTDKLPIDLATPYCVCQFTCACGAIYVHWTTTRLSERLNEHHSRWPNRGPTMNRRMAITMCLTKSDHLIDTIEASCLVCKVSKRPIDNVRDTILSGTEASQSWTKVTFREWNKFKWSAKCCQTTRSTSGQEWTWQPWC